MNDFLEQQTFPKKRYGQNFLYDNNVINNIIDLSGGLKGKNVLEIGGGTGSLTKRIIKENPKNLIVIEVDKDLIPVLKRLEGTNQKNVKVVCGDVLKFDILEHFQEPPIVIGNLPYNISTKILTNLLISSPPTWEKLILMFQLEVAERIISKPNNKNFGRLSVFAQFCSEPSLKMKLSNKVFFPNPKVKSAVVVFNKRDKYKKRLNSDLFFLIVKKCFSQRRKKVTNCLKDLCPAIDSVLKECNINLANRAENLSVDDYYMLTNMIQRKNTET